MNKNILRKVLATMLVLSMTLVNFVMLATESFALNANLETQGMNTNNSSVSFDVYFKDEKGAKVHTTTTDINKTTNLYLYVSVGEGYLKDCKITLNNPNFKLISDGISNDEIQIIDVEESSITLNKIRKGEKIELAIPVKAIKDDIVSYDMFSKETGISISGLLVKDNTKTTAISKIIRVKANWEGTAEINLEQGVIKYVPYEYGEEKGIVLQTKIKANLIDSNLPIEKTNIQTVIPKVNGISPKNIYVMSDSTKATNGEDGSNFNTSNWNKEENTINIEVVNRVEENKIVWKKDCVDEYIVTYIYGEEAFETTKENPVQILLETKAEIKAYNFETTKLTKENKISGTLDKKVNDVILFNVSSETINKGYMYTGNETKYSEKLTIDVANEKLVNNIVIEEKENKLASDSKEYDVNLAYQETKVNKDNFKTILGENGYINLYNENNQLVAQINKDAQLEGNNYVVNYDTNVTSLKVETSNFITVGKLNIENIKVILSNFTKEQVKEFKTLNTQLVGNVIYNEEKILTQNINETLTFIEPQTKVQTTISNDTLSTIVNNENVEIRTILESSDITCKLFKEPTIEIKLPDYVENVTFNDVVKVLFTDELEIATGTYDKNTRTIRVTLKGEQTKFNDVSIAKGPTIVLNCNIKLNELTPSKEDELVTTITNEEEVVETRTNINYVAPIGMVTVNTITGANDGNQVTSVSGQESTGMIDTHSNSKTSIATLTLINNNNNACKNIVILGRTPFEGNKSITTNEDLGSTFTAELISKIKAVTGIENERISVFYSSNENATKELSDNSNGWTIDPQNLAEVKSYLIVVNNYEMQTGEMLSFEYSTKIPEGLRNDEKTFGTFVVYYDNIIEKKPVTQPVADQTNTIVNNTIENNVEVNNTVQNTNTAVENTTPVANTIVENTTTTNNTTTNNNTNNTTNTEKEVLVASQTQAPTVGLATAELPDVKVTLTTDLPDTEYIPEGQVINYTATVVNMGKDTINDLTLTIPVPVGTTCRKYIPGSSYSEDEIIKTEDKEVKVTIPKLESNKSEKLELQVIVNEMKENSSIQAKAILNIKGYDPIESETIKSTLIEGILNIDLFTYLNQKETYKTGDEIKYRAYVQNIKENEDATGVTISCTMPEAVQYVEAKYIDVYDNENNKVEYDEKTNTVTWKIKRIVAESYKGLILVGKVKEGFNEITNQMAATCLQSTETTFSNEVKRYVENVNLVVEHTSDVSKEYVDVGDKINYYINVTNNGTKIASDIEIIDTLPNGVENVNVSYKTDTLEENNIPTKNGKVTLSGHRLEAGETLKITVNATVSELDKNAKGTIELRNSVSVKANDIEEIKPNDVVHKIKVKEQPKDPDKKEISISGVAWLDTSRDGKRDDNEELLKNIEVTLITKEDAKVVKTAKTNKNGEYTFNKVENGEYLVVFAFDTTKYAITKYLAEGVNEGKNSDAALQQVTFLDNGKAIEGAVTNTIKVQNSNLYNIDIGLVENLKFDLSLTKTISKVTKQNDEGAKTYDYTGQNKTLAKIEIPSKQVNKTSLVIEYTITIKNEGNIAGYAKNIVDYLPNDLKFVSELNKDWYKASDGKIYNKSLENILIQPGESKEIKLVVTKVTSENNLGTTNNSAEIYESYNDYGVKDIDSVEANKVAKEDDYGSADLLVSLNTGTVVMYTGLIITLLIITGVGAYMIKKKVLIEM